MITIRQATISDLNTVQQFGYELLKYEHDRWDPTLDLDWPFSDAGEAMYRKAISNRYVTIAYLDGNPVGYLIGTIQTPPPGSARATTTAQLNNIYVHESARKSGIGHALANDFHRYCLEHQAQNINVTVNTANEIAITFYRREGFLPSRLILKQDLTKQNPDKS